MAPSRASEGARASEEPWSLFISFNLYSFPHNIGVMTRGGRGGGSGGGGRGLVNFMWNEWEVRGIRAKFWPWNFNARND